MENYCEIIVKNKIAEMLPYYGKEDIVDHLYNEGFTDYIVDCVGEEFTEEDLPTSEIVACWQDIRDDIIEREIEKIDWE